METVRIEIDDPKVITSGGVTISKALEACGFKIYSHPEEEGLFVPCGTGGCWNCIPRPVIRVWT
jgi:pyruvate formate lyase activating enzyme